MQLKQCIYKDKPIYIYNDAYEFNRFLRHLGKSTDWTQKQCNNLLLEENKKPDQMPIISS